MLISLILNLHVLLFQNLRNYGKGKGKAIPLQA